MVTTTQKIVISGYYGFKNSGDEAVLSSILTALEEQGKAQNIAIEPIVLSIDPEWTTSTYGVRAVHRMRLGEVKQALQESHGLISGGGSLLQDVTGLKTVPYYLGVIKLAQWLGKPTFIYAQGIGPVNRGMFHPFIKNVFNKCEYISVRDTQSSELLQRMGVSEQRIQVVPDPVMGLRLPENEMRSAEAVKLSNLDLPVVGVSVRYWDQERRELKAIAAGLKKLCEAQAVHIRFLPFYAPDDAEASRLVIEHMGDVSATGSVISTADDAILPQHMLQEVSHCDAILGMRLHSLIYAANVNVPMAGVSYDPKINHFLRRLHIDPVGSTAELDANVLCQELQRLITDGNAWREEHAADIQQLKQEAQSPAQHISQYLCHRG